MRFFLHQADAIILFLFLGGSSLLYLASTSAKLLLPHAPLPWLLALGLNLLTYSTILLPGYAIITYVRRSDYLEKPSASALQPLVRLLVQGRAGGGVRKALLLKTAGQEAAKVVFCSLGLLGAYASWGYIQEKIMTKEYEDSLGARGQFSESQFLVFVDRLLAFSTALAVGLVRRQPRRQAPIFQYSFCSLSNILSSWCQLEALKYVSFPTQVLAKATKVTAASSSPFISFFCQVIPVMLMGKVMSKTKHDCHEYVVAVLISVGMAAFLMGGEGEKEVTHSS